MLPSRPAIHTMNGRSGWLVPEARADLAVVVQAMSEHSLHTSLTGKTPPIMAILMGAHWLGQVSLVDPPHLSSGSFASILPGRRDVRLGGNEAADDGAYV
jgi:hypothetical protein